MTVLVDAIAELGFDPDALRAKYLAERDKRLRKDGNAQYIDLSGNYAEYADDPYVEPGFTRDPITEETDAVVLGGGLAGLMTAARLRDEGVERMRIIEQAGDFGGTWYWNRYPGIRCDIEAYIYMPLLEEVGTVPTEKYARGREILEHCWKLGQKYRLYDVALFQTVVQSIRWEDGSGRWIVRTDRGDVIKTRHLIAGSGPLNRPKLPGIPGIGSFKGRAFHTSRWDYGYTGGNEAGDLTGLKDKTVALIGTGATGIQVLPYLADAAEHVYVFQRTPSSVDLRNNRPTDVEWFKSQPPGWQQRRMDNFMLTVMGVPQPENMVDDCWTDVATVLGDLAKLESKIVEDATPEQLFQLADFTKMEQLRKRIDRVVKDSATADALKPWYNLFCKRPLFSDEYLDVFNRSNGTLVDTHGKGVERVTQDALIVDGKTYPVDCIVYATGFQAGVYTHESGGYELVGRNGVMLKDRWEDSVRSVHGTQIHGFPNFHIVGGLSQAATVFNYPHVTSQQARHAARIVADCLKRDVKAMEVTEAAEHRWAEEMVVKSTHNVQFEMECTPGYYNNEGSGKGRKSLFGGMYGGGPVDYMAALDRWYSTDRNTEVSVTYN